MKTNDIKLYILTHINIEEDKRVCALDYKGLLNCLDIDFKEYAKERLSLGYSEKACFVSYCGGLPSVFKVTFVTLEQKELLKQWGISTRGIKEENVYLVFYNAIYTVFKKWRDNEWK